MSDEQPTQQDDGQRVARLTTDEIIPEDAPPPKTKRGTFDDRRQKRQRAVPRSYSTLAVSDDERLWTSIAHGSVWVTLLLSIFTVGYLAPVCIFIPLLIYFAFRNRSDYVAFHALQAFVLQLIGTVGAVTLLLVGAAVWGIGLAVVLLAMLILIGFILLPLWGIVGIALLLAVVSLPLAMLVFGTIATIETYHGHDYRYPLIAHYVDRQLAGGLLSGM